MQSGCFHFGNYCPFLQLARLEDVLQMLADGRLLNAEQLGYLQLRQPNAFVVQFNLQSDGFVRLVDNDLVLRARCRYRALVRHGWSVPRSVCCPHRIRQS